GARRAQRKSRFRRCKISQRRTAQETPPPLKQVVVLADAAEDLEAARDFYNGHEPGVGEYCIDSLLTDIESLGHLSGIHPLHFDCHRMLASRFPIWHLLPRARQRNSSVCDSRSTAQPKLDPQGIR